MITHHTDRVTPLPAQPGLDPTGVPEDLADVLFAGDLSTFALIDAAKVVNLAEFLESSGLEHACLFAGEALETCGAAAPWIVRLGRGAALTR